ncbi:transglutaminase domain-containing protein [Solidesulfovibrio carbinoliphilus subsp. oakridgensis]|uniref:Transglutaminase domain-containing protein n=1 Tax=Solidesulfovibrio carbinoliphilus subsp. oakridgensis TaxID=694327 RepID=G7QD90_9BACT|nr:transglutaminase family protein [Solidesulfovibrio carbinoliphilus]EHJ46396.1 transglutaminase domain-containing protein [Solidesulfovibrio carbinoliphilus subsp. oakridgensis]
MQYRLTHRTAYAFDRPVFLEPHHIRLVPRGDGSQRLHALDVAIEPEPAGRSLLTDLHGNTVVAAWFGGLADRLVVTTTARGETLRPNPFDYLPDQGADVLPVPLSKAAAASAAPCLAPVRAPHGEAAALADRLVRDGARGPQAFAQALLGWMAGRLATVARPEPGLLSPDAVLARGQGACRDLAVFFLAACRRVGLPARFVSGYHEGEPESGERDLHAWAEAYLPGGGWRGFDPSLGLAVADRHVAVAAAPDPEDAAPVVGAFRGEGNMVGLTHAICLEMS